MEEKLETIYQGIMEGDLHAVKDAVQDALAAGHSPEIILKQAMVAAMEEVGRLFEAGEFYVPEMLISARSMQAGLELLKPFLIEADVQPTGKIAIGTVKGDLHNIGKNLVAMMLEGGGYTILDLGVDVSPEKFVEAVRDNDLDILALSALLTTTMPQMKATLEALRNAGVREKVKVMVGGAPVTAAFANQIGADGYAADASQAVVLAKNLLKQTA